MPLPASFAEPSRLLDVEIITGALSTDHGSTHTITIKGDIPQSANGGQLAIWLSGNPKQLSALQGQLNGKSVDFTPCVPAKKHAPPPWQAWQAPVLASTSAQPFVLSVNVVATPDPNSRCRALFVPN